MHGVHGEAPVNTTGVSWAGYFQGEVYSPYGSWTSSDSQLKQNIQDLENASITFGQLQPKTYEYNIDSYGYMGLPLGPRMGLLADEVETVLPNAVKNTTQPAEVDSLGNVIHPSLDFKVMNYQEFIPLLIAGFQEQQSVITEQQALITTQDSINSVIQDRMDQLEQLLAACCQNPADPRNQQIDGTGGTEENEHILRIQPNPFDEQTTIYYQLERSGRMQLMANSSDGKQLRVLDEAQREAGEYRYDWLTADLAPGIYYVTLLLDGEPVVKKAVKVR